MRLGSQEIVDGVVHMVVHVVVVPERTSLMVCLTNAGTGRIRSMQETPSEHRPGSLESKLTHHRVR